ncbi:MAG: hypothetical protein M4D80_00870 [Myxococcota bacterium]|nr:hypothetical protein [Myxococcota bacterium]
MTTADESELVVGVDPAKELVITDPRVIASPLETTFDPARPSGTHASGAWSFGRLVHNMLPAGERDSGAAASRLVMDWLHTWETDQSPNPEVSAAKARASIRLMVTEPWKVASGCDASPETDATCVLDLAKSPFRLIAIVNRPDLRRGGDDAIGGEGRFVFQIVGPTLGRDAATGAMRVMNETVKPQKFTVIFEYSLPVSHRVETLVWAHRWHVLRVLPFGHGYNAMLRTITNGFSGPDRDSRRPNGNALNQLRTNEVALMGARFPTTGFIATKQFWELREFHLTQTGLAPHTVNLEPSRDFDVFRTGHTGNEGTRTAELAAFLVDEAAAITAEKHKLWPGMSGNSALIGSSPYGAWGNTFAGVDPAVRNAFALNTCAGCHRHETETRHFMHITTVAAMEPADKTDDRARIGVTAETPEDAVVLSNLLAADIAPGGKRHEDYAKLLATRPSELR